MEGWSESSMMKVSDGGKVHQFKETALKKLVLMECRLSSIHYIALLMFIAYLFQVLKI